MNRQFLVLYTRSFALARLFSEKITLNQPQLEGFHKEKGCVQPKKSPLIRPQLGETIRGNPNNVFRPLESTSGGFPAGLRPKGLTFMSNTQDLSDEIDPF